MGAWGLQERMFLEAPCKQESSTKAFVPIMATGAKPQLRLRPEPAGVCAGQWLLCSHTCPERHLRGRDGLAVNNTGAAGSPLTCVLM